MNLKSLLAFLLCSALFGACKTVPTDQFEGSGLASSSGGEVSACVGYQGNGTYFSTQVGQLIALLEAGIKPKYAAGGSSASILAALSRGIVTNPTLSRPQDAAKVLAAAGAVIESIMFLPNFVEPLELFAAFQIQQGAARIQALASSANNGLVHYQSIAAQGVLVVDFFARTNFSSIKNLSYTEREKAIVSKWKTFVGGMVVSRRDVAKAIFTNENQLDNNLRTVQKRLFELFRTGPDNGFRPLSERRKTWNEFLTSAIIKDKSDDEKEGMLVKLLETVKTIESFDAVYSTFNDTFILPDPRIILSAFGGNSPAGGVVQIPSNTIIHTTARRGRKTTGLVSEEVGLENLYQVYFTAAANADSVGSALRANNPHSGVILDENVVTIGTILSKAISSSVSEPTVFIRDRIDLASSSAQVPWAGGSDMLVGYGGWLEKAPTVSLSKLPECSPENVDLVYLTTDLTKISNFGKAALSAVYTNRISTKIYLTQPNTPFRPSNPEQLRQLGGAIQAAERNFDDILNYSGRRGSVVVRFNHSSPTGNKDVNIEFRSNRRSLILGSYEFAKAKLQSAGFGGNVSGLWAQPVSGVLSSGSVDALRQKVNSAMPRPDLTAL